MRELFIATSYHHIMSAIAKKNVNCSEMDVLISNFSTGDEYWLDILDNLKNTGWFNKIIFFDERKKHPPKPNSILKTIAYELFLEKRIIKNIKELDLDVYDMIYVIDDKMFPAATIIKKKKNYHLCEDTAYAYQNMNLSGSSKILKAPYRKIQRILKIIHYWHPVYGYAKCCTAIEASSKENLPNQLPLEKVIVVDRNNLLNELTEQDRLNLCKIFIPDLDISLLKSKSNNVLIMTSLYRRHEQIPEEQIRICEKIMKLYDGKSFYIKPHPRDLTNYKNKFPNITILNPRFPSELLNYYNDILFDEVVSVGSTAVNTCKFAKKTKYLSLKDIGENIPDE